MCGTGSWRTAALGTRPPLKHHGLQGITMAMRDRIALAVLAGGCLAALAVWHPLGPWPALVLGLLAVMAAGVVYRLEPSAIRFGHWPPETEPPEQEPPEQEPSEARQDRVGQ